MASRQALEDGSRTTAWSFAESAGQAGETARLVHFAAGGRRPPVRCLIESEIHACG